MKIINDNFIFLPLGGSSEIGMNANLYHYQSSWILIDLGISFADETMPGVDILLPDIEFIERRKDNLEAIILTHGHEDHMGAIQYLWDKLRVPIYGSPFTIALLKRKLKETGMLNEVSLFTFEKSKSFELGPFKIEPIWLTHSIPDPISFAISTKVGTVYHSGDWKFDSSPQIGSLCEIESLKRISKNGILAFIGDSTNSMVEGNTKSEKDAYQNIFSVLSKSQGRVFVTCFASNVARIKSIITASDKCGKKVVLAGRSLHRVMEAASEVGYLSDLPDTLSLKEIDKIPHDKLVVIAAGSQGEIRSTMTRISNGNHELIKVKPGDTAIFSSSKIPGNELAISRVHNSFMQKGVKVITDDDELIHVSGHPGRDDMKKMYDILNPQISIPVHGTAKHISMHSELAYECGVSLSIEPENGSIINLSGNSPGVIGQIKTNASVPDGNQIIKSDSNVFSLRRKMLWNGAITIVIVLDQNNEFLPPLKISQNGVVETSFEIDFLDEIKLEIEELIDLMPKKSRIDEITIKDKIRRSVRKIAKIIVDRKPIIDIHIVRTY